LLTEDELQSIIDTFDEDINPKGGFILTIVFLPLKMLVVYRFTAVLFVTFHSSWTRGDLTLLVCIYVVTGGQITLDEFIEYKRKQLDYNMSEVEHKLSQLEFRMVDTDGSGTIDWWEFLNFQAKVKLASRDQVILMYGYS
jgi:hypothetical protein